jgi:hypothetical protein
MVVVNVPRRAAKRGGAGLWLKCDANIGQKIELAK